jgi:CBS domain-containing protein
MKVKEVMRKNPRLCAPAHTLATAAAAMAEVDCGVLPVVGERGKVVGVITDRDICLALARGDRRPSEVTVEAVMRRSPVHTCRANDEVRRALAIMREGRVRRLPVVGAGGELEGLLSIDDVVLEARALATADFSGPFYIDIAETFKAINQHRVPEGTESRPAAPKRSASRRSPARRPEGRVGHA